jgi:hypothetical protein
MDCYTVQDGQFLNALKNRIREITKLLDTSKNVYPDVLEARQVKHEALILLEELHVHGLLPALLQISDHPPLPQEEKG